MDWSFVFSAVNIMALIAWVGLIALPRWPALLSAILYLGVGLLCLIYSVLLISVLGGFIPAGEGGADFTTIEGVRSIFVSDVGVTIGWTHYLAFDLFVGIWIARDADAKFFSRWLQAPILLATFMAGPLGLIIWLIVREPRSRASGRWS
ncbi:ABA4-like family protein [Erythrobacter sp. F6033]|uniref:ABA4-like family protein n=1 Tax=Erythrobacter sp. F6033 TaxID=2926401 RepID=UPI001FF12AC3|nr:ABA4-like family protein [Erythrobacter sp. F6033]MCK0128893.1 ABA4-like family protein [Erythrobacter sp. F6033]